MSRYAKKTGRRPYEERSFSVRAVHRERNTDACQTLVDARSKAVRSRIVDGRPPEDSPCPNSSPTAGAGSTPSS